MEFSIFKFPFEQIGWALRQLSLSGEIGNIFAIIIYIFASLIPCLVYLWLIRKGTNCKADWMLPLLSIGLFIVLYFMINPGLFIMPGVSGGKELLGCTFYSVLIGYMVLRIMKKSAQADTKSLQKGLRTLLYVVILLFGYVVIEELVFNLPANIQALQKANTATEEYWLMGDFGYGSVDLTMTYIFLGLQSVVNVLPYVLNIWVLWLSARGLKELLENPYTDESVTGVAKIASACLKTLTIVAITSMCFNVAQLIFRNSLYQMQVTASVPLLSILFAIVILVVARYVGENQKLKRDNDLFI